MISKIRDNIDFIVVEIWMLLLPITVIYSKINESMDYNIFNIALIVILSVTYLVKIVRNKNSFKPLDLLLMFLMILNIISALNAINVNTGIYGFLRQNGLLTYLVYILIVLNVSKYGKKKRKVLSLTMLYIGVVNVIAAIYQVFFLVSDRYIFDIPYMGYGLCENPNFLGGFMALLLSFMISLYCYGSKNNSRVIILLLCEIFLFGLIIAQSTGPLIGLLVGMFLLFLMSLKNKMILKKFLTISSILFVSFFMFNSQLNYEFKERGYVLDDNYTITGGLKDLGCFVEKFFFKRNFNNEETIGSGRLTIWRKSLPLLDINPLFGIGPDNYHLVYDQRSDFYIVDAHNVYLNYAINFGLISFMLVIIIAIVLFFRSFFIRSKATRIFIVPFITYCALLFFNISVICASTYFYIFVGLLISVLNEHYSKKKDILLVGYYGYGNKGDDFVAKQIIDNLSDDITIGILVGSKYDVKNKKNVTYLRRNIFTYLGSIKSCDYVVTGGGSLIQDVSSSRSFNYYLLLLKIAKWNKKKIIMYGNGLGPLSDRHIEMLRKANLPVELGLMRDNKSLELFKRIWPNVKAILSGDELFTYKYKMNDNYNDGICLSLSYDTRIREVFYPVDEYCYKNNIPLNIIVMDKKNDNDVAKQAIEKAKSDVYYYENITLDELINLVQNSRCVVSMRLHLLIISLMVGKMPIAISKGDYKIDEVMPDKRYIFNLCDISKNKLVKALDTSKKEKIDNKNNKSYLNKKELLNMIKR